MADFRAGAEMADVMPSVYLYHDYDIYHYPCTDDFSDVFVIQSVIWSFLCFVAEALYFLNLWNQMFPFVFSLCLSLKGMNILVSCSIHLKIQIQLFGYLLPKFSGSLEVLDTV